MATTGSGTPAPLLTGRLLLRPLTADDAGALLRFRAHPAATRYLSHGPLTPAQNSARLEQTLSAAASSTAEWFHFGWAIELRATGEVVGDARAWNTQEPPAPGRIPADSASLGYVLHPEHHGLGLGREAAGALVDWLFGARGSETIFAGVYEPNLHGTGRPARSCPELPHPAPADMSSAPAREWTQCPHAHSSPPRMSMSRGSSEHVHSLPAALGMSGGDKTRSVCHSVTIQRRGRHGDKLG